MTYLCHSAKLFHSYTSFTVPTLLYRIVSYREPHLISQYLASMENKSLDITNDSPASLHLLPGELLTKIMSFAMASDVPVFLWLFRNRACFHCVYDFQPHCVHPRTLFPDRRFSGSQQQHYLDWISVTSTCRRMRECGIPAFFREKRFLVPPRMLRDLLDGKVRSSNLDLAMGYVRKVVVPLRSLINGSDFMILPKYHRFPGLSAMTIRPSNVREDLLYDWELEKLWLQKETPKELHDLLRQLGLRVDITKLKLETVAPVAPDESVSPSLIEDFEKFVYPALRTLIQQRTKLGVVPP